MWAQEYAVTMGFLDRVKQQLSRYEGLHFEESEGGIDIAPASPSGFSLRVEGGDGFFLVGYEAWHEHFDSEDEALRCLAFGLSLDCRLKVVKRSGKAYRWTVEVQEEGEWKGFSTTGLIFFPFWRPRSTVFLSNAFSHRE